MSPPAAPPRRLPVRVPYARATLTLLAASVCLAATGCAATHTVRPLGRGNAVAHASLGGPLVKVGGAILPAPILSLGGGLGLRDDAEVTLHADATAAAFGVAHVEPGVAYHPLIRDAGAVPTLTLAASLHLLTNVSDTRVAPQATAAAAWRVRGRHLLYVGTDVAVTSGHRVRVIAGPLAGGELRVGRHAGLVLEAKWLAPYYDVAPLAPTWISPASRGYLSVLLGANLYWGDVR